MVYSAYDTHPSASPTHSLDEDYYTDYEIHAADGRLLQKVSNCENPVVSVAPAKVKLSPGRYQVVALSNTSGTVNVPVIIVEGRLTTLHLDGDSSWASAAGLGPADAVRLPDGQIIGWRAEEGVR